jgi:hypothetical protein
MKNAWVKDEYIKDFCEKASRKESTRTTYTLMGITVKWILEKQDTMVWTELIWLRIGTSGGLLLTWL